MIHALAIPCEPQLRGRLLHAATDAPLIEESQYTPHIVKKCKFNHLHFSSFGFGQASPTVLPWQQRQWSVAE